MILLGSFIFLWASLYPSADEYGTTLIHPQSSATDDLGLSFNLKHIYHKVPNVVYARLDIDDYQGSINEMNESIETVLDKNGIDRTCNVKAKFSQIQRISERDPDSVESYIYHSLQHPEINTWDALDWSIDNVLFPDITDPETILQLAKLASNAYARLPADPSWRNVSDPDTNFGKGFNNSDSFGWAEAGIRGHVFVEDFNGKRFNRSPLIIIAIKGTTAAGLGGGNGADDGDGGKTGDDGKTVEMDKLNDNLLFSCCCARVSSLWSTVCDCYEKTYTCNQNCLEQSLRHPDRYYKAVLDIYRDVKKFYPDSEVWVTGHSLGGALSSLLGRTYGLPVVTFESPGEMLATKRLHLPSPPGLPVEMEHIWHFGNNADPIFMGVCNGASSSCGIAGYAMETVCHSGLKCIYDTVRDMGWHVNILNHRLKTVIDDLLVLSNETAVCKRPPPCIDCYDWTFVDHTNNRRRIISSSSSSSTSKPTTTTSDPSKPKKCLKRTWYGYCYKWEGDDDDDGDDKKGGFWHPQSPLQTGI